MEHSRQEAYLALIQRLLQCPVAEESVVLDSHRELLDEGFLKMSEQLAQMLEERGDQNTAHWLRNMATRLREHLKNPLNSIQIQD